MKALIKLRVYDGFGGDLLDEKTVNKEFETAMPLRELVDSVLEEFQLQQMTVQSLKLFDNTSTQLVGVRAVKFVRDMTEYEVSLVGGVDRARIADQPPCIRLDDTVVELKVVIGELEDARPEEVQVTFQCGLLHGNRTLREYGIKAGAELDVQMPLRGADKRNGPYEVAGSCLTDTVGRLKELIYSREGIPLKDQLLIFAGKRLEDNKTLADYNIQKDSMVHMVLELRGC